MKYSKLLLVNLGFYMSHAPMGLQWGEIGKNNLGDCLFFSDLFNVVLGYFGVFIESKMAT